MQHLQQSAPIRQRLIKQRLAAAVLQGIACMGVAAPLLLASAQVQAAQQQLDFNIPGGPLGAALAQFGETAHLLISYPAELTEGRVTQGLSGRFEIDNGLDTLLAGTGLQALRTTQGGYQIARRQNSDALQLDALTISGKAPGSTTEGTGS